VHPTGRVSRTAPGADETVGAETRSSCCGSEYRLAA